MFKILVMYFLVQASLLCGEMIRAFDLGGQGLKTALLSYDEGRIEWIEGKVLLGMCPDDREVGEWIRGRMRELGKDLDGEVEQGYIFGFSLAGLDKLRVRALEGCDMAVLFGLPEGRVRCIDDGGAHLVASLNTLGFGKGPVWNFSLGTGVGWGFSDEKCRVRNLSDFWEFFGQAPWFVVEERTGLDVWNPCSSFHGFDQLVADNGGVVDEGVFTEFALRWKGYIDKSVMEYSVKVAPEKSWGTPVAVVFTGGHIEVHGERLMKKLKEIGVSVPVFTGPKYAGLLGAAWNAMNNPFGQTELVKRVGAGDVEGVKFIIAEGADVNERDALGKSPLAAAIEGGNLELVRLLVQHGAGVNNADFAGQTPLFLAVRANNAEIVRFLLEHGADIITYDYWNRTPLFFANGNEELESLLGEQ